MTKEDSGLYTCTVCNSLGCDTAQASLSTEGQSLSKMMPFIVTHVCFLQMLFNVFFFLSLGLCFVLFFVHLQMFFFLNLCGYFLQFLCMLHVIVIDSGSP